MLHVGLIREERKKKTRGYHSNNSVNVTPITSLDIRPIYECTNHLFAAHGRKASFNRFYSDEWLARACGL